MIRRINSLIPTMTLRLLTQGAAAVLLITTVVGCAGNDSPSTDDQKNNEAETDLNKSADTDKTTKELEALLDKKQREDLKPTDRSPGPIMISMFTRHGESSQLKHRNGTPKQKKNPQSRLQQTPYLYMILVSKEWAYKNLPIREPFLQVKRPEIKILPDHAMNKYLKFLRKNSFKKFPEVNQVSRRDIKKLQRGDKYLTLWKGNDFQRVLFNDSLTDQIMTICKNNKSRCQELIKYKSNLLLGFARMFNYAPFSRIKVSKSDRNMSTFLQKLAKQAGQETSSELEELLKEAQVYYRKEKYEKAKTKLHELLQKSKGTTYYIDGSALLQKVNKAMDENGS